VRQSPRLDGSYAIAAVFSDSETVYAARHESPLVLGIGDDGHYLASDVPAFIEYTDRVVYLDDGQFARINPAGIVVTDAQGCHRRNRYRDGRVGSRGRRQERVRSLHAQRDSRTATGDSPVSSPARH